MIVLKYDNFIKESRDLGHFFGILWKIMCSTTLMLHNQDLTGSGFIMGGPFRHPSRLFNLKQAQIGYD